MFGLPNAGSIQDKNLFMAAVFFLNNMSAKTINPLYIFCTSETSFRFQCPDF